LSEKKPTILERWGITAEELTELVDNNGSLRGMMLGYVAEPMLKKMWFEKPPALYLGKHDDHNRMKKGDLLVAYKKHEFDIESKSLQTKMNRKDGVVWRGQAQVDGSDRRIVTLPDGSKIDTTLLLYSEFDILAVNIFSFENEWRFVFAKNQDLPHTTDAKYTEEQQRHLIKSMVHVSWPPEGIFRDEPFSLMDEIIEERLRNPKPPKLIIEKVAKGKKKKTTTTDQVKLIE
jgi:hypothetical protein